jgi:alpha-tubulin suppressor-like RCC1 family protein
MLRPAAFRALWLTLSVVLLLHGCGAVGVCPRVLSGNVEHTCLLHEGGLTSCFGRGEGRLGYHSHDNVGDGSTLLDVGLVPDVRRIVQLATGGSFTCTLSDDSLVRCWGMGRNCVLGLGQERDVPDAPSAEALEVLEAKLVRSNEAHSCAISRDQHLFCWGLNSDGRLGLGHTKTIGDDEHARDGLVGDSFADVALGPTHTCALRDDKITLMCWGTGKHGENLHPDRITLGDREQPSHKV